MIEKRIQEIIDILNKANYEYYVLDNPTLTDQEYDRYMQELIKLEEKRKDFKLAAICGTTEADAKKGISVSLRPCFRPTFRPTNAAFLR